MMIERNGVRWRLIRNVGRNALVIWHLVDLPLRSIEMKRKEKRKGKKRGGEREIGIHLSTCERPVKFITGGQVRRIVGKPAYGSRTGGGRFPKPTDRNHGRCFSIIVETASSVTPALRLSPFRLQNSLSSP